MMYGILCQSKGIFTSSAQLSGSFCNIFKEKINREYIPCLIKMMIA